jgi:predicted ATPase/transcriptional regulator with XRE-family HTH domain
MQNFAFGAMLRRLRLSAGLSQEALAERAAISLRAVNALERGYRKAPHADTVTRLLAALNPEPEMEGALRQAAERARFSGRAETALAGQSGRTHHFPRQLTSFVGRAGEVAQVSALIATSPLVTITGTGGIGKTRTALNVAVRGADTFADGSWLVDFSAISEPGLVVPAVAAALGVQEQPAALPALLAQLEQRNVLLVLDNCEHVLDEAGTLVTEILETARSVKILATSREPLHVAGERVYRLGSLAEPDAIELFVDRARTVDGRFGVGPERAPAIARICRALDGMPLAIELAASWSNVLSLSDLAERLLGLESVAGSTTAPRGRQQTMRSTLDWSYSLMGDLERRLFTRLSVFASAFTLEAAERVCAGEGVAAQELLPALRRLIEKSLVTREPGDETCYRLHETTRRYAREKLAQSEEHDLLVARHAAALLRLAEDLDTDWYDIAVSDWSNEVERWMDDWRVVLERTLVQRQDVGLGLQLVAALEHVWHAYSGMQGSLWISVALAELDGATDPCVAARIRVTAARLGAAANRSERSLEPIESAIETLNAAGEAREAAAARLARGWTLMELGRMDEAQADVQAVLAWGRANGNARLVAASLNSLGTIAIVRGDLPAAPSPLRESFQIAESRGWLGLADTAALNLAESEFGLGNAQAALRIACDVYERIRHRHRLQSVAHILSNIAAYLIALDCVDEGLARAREAFASARQMRAEVLALVSLQHVAAGLVAGTDTRIELIERARQAAAILGFVDAALAGRGARRGQTERLEYSRTAAALRALLGDDEFDRSTTHGSRWSMDEAAAAGGAPG